ncbi:LOW QUALITY PROTEIN: uncharacterized protein LOC110025828 [Phalaenopsis equestris]|uniref:LOW QUALITY PROTEIN: uncharacterized protein LOC110025828 n=1 Tax=Phalaenopsis equestris TaxID=78828 RepID=UPI0009E28953|nr:LOW QUALITY PROTEIN: uncharacterized protein LOC110025828 [Phalaenopsis equestris]
MGLRRYLFNSLFKRNTSRQIWKLKSLLSLTVCRLSVLRNQRNARCSHARSDIIQLLLLNQQDRALIRVRRILLTRDPLLLYIIITCFCGFRMQAELLIKEQNMADGFAMVESYCHSLSGHAFLHLSDLSRIISNEMQCLGECRECPEELKEAAAALCFAASRCGDLPELQEIRKILSSLFGKDFTVAAVELRSNCGVNAKMVQKFSLRSPSLESRVNVMKEIAMEKGVKLELINSHFSELSKVDESASQWTENQVKEMATPHLDSAGCWDDNVKVRAQDEYEDVVSAAQAAFESASYAAVAAKAAVKLFQSEAGKRCSSNESSCMRVELEDHIKHLVGNTVQEKQHIQASKWRLQEQGLNPNRSGDYSPLASRSSSIDNGFYKSKVRFPEMDLEKKGEDVLPESRVWSFRELTAHETQARIYFDGDHKFEDSELGVRILGVRSESRNNLAAHFPTMGKGSPR